MYGSVIGAVAADSWIISFRLQAAAAAQEWHCSGMQTL